VERHPGMRVDECREHGDYEAAERLARDEIDALRARHGPMAGELVPLLNELGMIGKYRGDFEAAEHAYREALAVCRYRGEVASEDVASLLHNLAGLAHARGDPVAAEPIARQGLAMRAKPEGPPALADRAALAAILVDLNRLGEAEAILAEVLAEYVRLHGPVHFDVAVTLHNLGSLRFRDGRFDEAAQTLRRAFEMKRTILGSDHPDLAITLYNLARCAQHRGDVDEAVACFLRAMEILEPRVVPTHPTLVACRARLEDLRRGTGWHAMERVVR